LTIEIDLNGKAKSAEWAILNDKDAVIQHFIDHAD